MQQQQNHYDTVQPPYTVETAMTACGFTDIVAARIASEFFDDQFSSCKNQTHTDMKDAFKSLASLSIASGGMKFTPKQKSFITNFSHWVKHQYRMGRDPALLRYPFTDTTVIKNKASIHSMYIERHETIATAAKPEKLTKDIRWDDWYPSFLNYLRTIPGRKGIPLQYVVRDNEMPTNKPLADYLDEYIDRADLNGDAYDGDTLQVHIYIVNLIAGNDEAESAIKALESERNGRKDWIALKQHYEGRGVFTNDVMQAEKDIKNLYYNGEKRPTMYWLLFEQRLNNAYHILVKKEGREVYSDTMKLRNLLDKVRVEWLIPIKSVIEVELTRHPITYTYDQAMLAFRTEVNRRFPPGSSAAKVRRTIQQLEGDRPQGRGYYGGRGRGRGGRGRGRGRGRGGRGYYSNNENAKTVTGKDGKKYDVHPKWNLASHIYNQLTDETKDWLREKRRSIRQNHGDRNSSGSKRSIEQLSREIDELRSINEEYRSVIPQNSNHAPTSVTQSEQRSTISQVTAATGIMGGRNEQIQNKQEKGSRG